MMADIRRRRTEMDPSCGTGSLEPEASLPDSTKVANPETLRSLVSDSVLGISLWTTMWQIAPCLWLLPLNAMTTTGWEGFVAVWSLMMLLLGPKSFRQLLGSPFGILILRLLGILLALGAYPLLPHAATLERYIAITIGVGFFCMAWALSFWGCPSSHLRGSQVNGLVLGVFVTLVFRIWCKSLNPLFTSTPFGYGAIAITVLVSFERFFSAKRFVEPAETPAERRDGPHWFFASCGIAALLFIQQLVFGEVAVLSRWVVIGSPNNLSPTASGAVVLLSLVIGVLFFTPFANNLLWWLVGALGGAVMYYANAYVGFAGGLVLAMYVGSVWPLLFHRLAQHRIARTMFTVVTIFILLIVACVWVNAYNFVPFGGEYTRERTDVLLAVTLSFIGLAACVGSLPSVDRKKFDEVVPRTPYDGAPPLARAALSPQSKKALLLIFIVGLAGIGFRYNAYHPEAWVEDKRVSDMEFQAAIWTVHFGLDNHGLNSFDHIADFVNSTGADVIGLLETDVSKPFLGSIDMTMYLAEKFGMYADFGPATHRHSWGCLLLSKYPIVKSEHFLLPSPHGELAPAILATLLIGGKHVDVLVVHMGVDTDDLDRKLQAHMLGELLNGSPNPIFFLGYITCQPDGRDYNQITQGGRMKDIDSTDRDRWCEYIFYRGLIRLSYARITHGSLTDTELQTAKFRVPSSDTEPDNDKVTFDGTQVAERLHFPTRFGEREYGHHTSRFFRDHHFHMNTPKYFTR